MEPEPNTEVVCPGDEAGIRKTRVTDLPPTMNETEPYMNQEFTGIAFPQAPQEARQPSSPYDGQRPALVTPPGPAVSPEQASAVPGADQYQPPMPTTPSYEHRTYMDHSLAESVNYPGVANLVYQMAASTMMNSQGGVYPEAYAPEDPSLTGVHSGLESSQPREQSPPPPELHKAETNTVLATGLGDTATPDAVKIWIQKRCGTHNAGVTRIKVPRHGPRIRGKAFIDFDTKEHTLRGVRLLNNSTFGGRKVVARVTLEGLPHSVRDRRQKMRPKQRRASKDQDPSTDEKGQELRVPLKRSDNRVRSKSLGWNSEDDDDNLETVSQSEGEAESDEDRVAPKMVRRRKSC